MATTQQVTAATEKSALNARVRTGTALLFWGIVVLLALRFISRFVVHYFTLDEQIFGRFWPHRAYLLPHLVGGTVALLMGPFQF